MPKITCPASFMPDSHDPTPYLEIKTEDLVAIIDSLNRIVDELNAEDAYLNGLVPDLEETTTRLTCLYSRGLLDAVQRAVPFKFRNTKVLKYKTEIMEMARIACASIHDDLQEHMDISDDLFIEIREFLSTQK
jgi:hypothetical protein